MGSKKLITGGNQALFIDADDWSRATLKGCRCNRCGSLDFPRNRYCKSCLSPDVREIKLSSRGHLYTFSYAKVCAKGFSPPYVFGYVDLPEGIRIYSQLEPADPAQFRAGMEVEVTLGEIRREEDGTEIWGYKFRPYVRG